MSYIRQLLIRQALRHKTNRPSGLIGQYKPYLNSNDSPTRDILKDYSGQGHDIQLYNFGYALQSGYGSYVYDFLDKTVFYCEILTEGVRGEGTVKNNSLHITKVYSKENVFEFKIKVLQTKSFKIRVSGLKEGQIVKYHSDFDLNNELIITSDGEYILPEMNKQYYGFRVNNANNTYPFDCNITIEQIPDYPGALVSDGVDDYGLCENFPILTKEKGYTVLYLCKRLKSSDSSYLLSNSGDGLGAFVIESSSNTYNFGNITNIEELQDLFRWQTSKSYCGINSLNIGNNTADDELFLFTIRIGDSRFCKAALYALEIYDHDLTDEEIESVKEAMISEYEKETGNVLEGV